MPRGQDGRDGVQGAGDELQVGPAAVAFGSPPGDDRGLLKDPQVMGVSGAHFNPVVTVAGLGEAELANGAGAYELPTNATIAAAAASFPTIAATGAMSLINSTAPGAYPIVNYEYAIVPDHYQKSITARDVKAFLHWAITVGNSPQYLGGTIMFQPLPAEVASLADIQIARIG